MLQNFYYTVGAANSTASQDYLQSQIITLLPRLTTLHILVKHYIKHFAHQNVMYSQTVTALTSLKHISDISFTIISERSTHSTQILRLFASSIRNLRLSGMDADWFIGDGPFSDFHPFLDGNSNIFRPWSFPNLQSLELRHIRRDLEIYAQIPLDTPLVTLSLNFNTVLGTRAPPPLPRRRVHRLVLWVFVPWIVPNPRFDHGISADILELMIHVESTDDLPLLRTFERLAEMADNLAGEITRKVTWKVECSTPELCTMVKEEFQEPSALAIFQSSCAAYYDRGLQWELEGP